MQPGQNGQYYAKGGNPANGYGFVDGSGNSISAGTFAQMNNLDPWSLLSQMASSGDTGARDALVAKNAASASGAYFNQPSAFFWGGTGGHDSAYNGSNHDNPDSSISGTSSSSGYGTSYGGSTNPNYHPPDYATLQNAYSQNFDSEINNLHNSQNLAQQVSNQGQNQVNQSYGVQKSGIDQQLAQGHANLDLAQQQLDTSKSRGLRDLGNQMRMMINSYGNQAGVMGAGDSSAMPMLSMALTNEANRNRGDLLQNVSQQQSGINLQGSQLDDNYQQQVKMLDDWKSQQLSSIVNNYASQLQQIQQQTAGLEGQKAIDLAYIGQGQAANEALQKLQALEAGYNANTNQLQTAYGQLQAPTTDISKYSQQFQVNPVDAGQIQKLNFQNNAAGYTPDNIPITLLRKNAQTA